MSSLATTTFLYLESSSLCISYSPRLHVTVGLIDSLSRHSRSLIWCLIISVSFGVLLSLLQSLCWYHAFNQGVILTPSFGVLLYNFFIWVVIGVRGYGCIDRDIDIDFGAARDLLIDCPDNSFQLRESRMGPGLAPSLERWS